MGEKFTFTMSHQSNISLCPLFVYFTILSLDEIWVLANANLHPMCVALASIAACRLLPDCN